MDLDGLETPEAASSAAGSQDLGWRLRALSNQERSLLDVAGGLWVDEVSTVSSQAGLLPGDVLLAINLRPMLSIEDVLHMVRDRPQQLALLIDRDGRRMFIPMFLE